MADQKYECKTCGKTATVRQNDPIPFCCGKPMEVWPLEACTTAPSAEHARTDSLDEPCDDGRAG